MSLEALTPQRVILPDGEADGLAVLVRAGRIEGVCAVDAIPAEARRVDLQGVLAPGFIDLQVNGGGGLLFNDAPTAETAAAIAAAHRPFGATGLLPTLISDDLASVARALDAVDQAIAAGAPGVFGAHIEGPFLNAGKKGVHDSAKFRVLDQAAIDLLSQPRRGKTLLTLAPELAPPGAIAALVRAGVIVFAGHTLATYADMQRAIAEGLSGATHLFNAMSGLEARSPGVVGAALEAPDLFCGVIVDGFHVHAACLRIALRAKGPGRLALVTDAMPPVGSERTTFKLGDQLVTANGGRLAAEDGTLAGSMLDMASAVRNAQAVFGVPAATAIGMASAVPAAAIGLSGAVGAIRPGLRADLVLLDTAGAALQTWIGGQSKAHR